LRTALIFAYISPHKKPTALDAPATIPWGGEEDLFMRIPARYQLTALISAFLLLPLFGCSSIDKSSIHKRNSTTGTFPVPSEIEDNVAFWRSVYAEWSRGQVAIHDDEHMGVIYEVLDLPGLTRAGYTTEQKRFVQARTAYYKSRLEGLEAKVRAGRSPSGSEEVLYDKLVDAGGKRAIYGASDRVRCQRGLRERFRRGLEVSGRYDAKFREIFRSRGLPEDLAYLPHVESSFQPHARSSVGAAGMWQFTRGTGKIYMTVNGTVDERLDPVIAAEGAARYLSDAHRKLGSWPLAVTSYNHGQGGMKKAKAIYGDDIGTIVRSYKGPYFGFASRNFYSEFIAAREVASNPGKYFPGGVRYQAPLAEDRLVLRHSMPAPRVARHYGVSTFRLADLNMHWQGPARDGRANLPAGTTVWLPSGTLGRVARAPAPMPVMLAKAEPEPEQKPVEIAKAEPKPIKIAQAEPEPKPVKIAKAEPEPKPIKIAKAEPKPKSKKVANAQRKPKPAKVAQAESKPKKGSKTGASGAAKVHVVKPNETLYRVATYYELSVKELRRLNRMGPEDTNIRPGQRLRVSG
jgi:membrane-bound lytic murein transglycosylase D